MIMRPKPKVIFSFWNLYPQKFTICLHETSKKSLNRKIQRRVRTANTRGFMEVSLTPTTKLTTMLVGGLEELMLMVMIVRSLIICKRRWWHLQWNLGKRKLAAKERRWQRRNRRQPRICRCDGNGGHLVEELKAFCHKFWFEVGGSSIRIYLCHYDI